MKTFKQKMEDAKIRDEVAKAQPGYVAPTEEQRIESARQAEREMYAPVVDGKPQFDR